MAELRRKVNVSAAIALIPTTRPPSLMKEIIDLHQRVVAHYGAPLEDEPVDFSRDEFGERFDELPDALRDEIRSLQASINAVIPEDFDYFVFVGAEGDEDSPVFDLMYGNTPVGEQGESFDATRSLLEQLPQTDWDAKRRLADERDQTMSEILAMLERKSAPLPSTKSLQKLYREETKDFIKEKRADTTKLHVLYWEDSDGMMEADFADGAAFRAALPDMILDGCNLITVVVNGKPLPVERIDALNVEAQEALRTRPLPERGPEEGDVVDIEAEEVVRAPEAALPMPEPEAAPEKSG